ncbi:hypothetical protein DW790_14585 [Firmicutes bacterium AM31-12AC]|nr:hypothetical protein DW790_14585 [Firmicutes bacterium AM31-12AC]
MKKKSLQKMSRLFASAVLVGTMCLGNVANVNAADNNGPATWKPTDTPSAAITVEYKMGNDVVTPENDVSFTFTKTAAPSGMSTNDMPAISVANVKFNAGEDLIKDTTAKDIKVLRKQSNNFLASFKTAMDSSTNMTTGEYVYTVKSTSTVKKAKTNDVFTASKAEYKLNIFVAQDTNGKLYIKGLSIINTKTDAGADNTDGTKVNGNPGTTTGGIESNFSGLKFVNEYVAKAGSVDPTDPDVPDPNKPASYAFKVTNNTESKGTQTGSFDYTMTVTKPSGIATTDNTYVYYVNGKQETGTYGAEVTFTLPDTKSMMIKSCYAGSKVTVDQQGVANWTAIAKTMFNGKADSSTLTAAVGKNLKVENKTLGQQENKVDYTNTYKDIAVTGIIVNNFPFIIMIAIAVVAFAGIVAMNSKKRMNRR